MLLLGIDRLIRSLKLSLKKKLHIPRVGGIEPPIETLKVPVLPLNYTPFALLCKLHLKKTIKRSFGGRGDRTPGHVLAKHALYL